MNLVYDRKSARYRDRESGRFIARKSVLDSIDRVVMYNTRKLDALTDQLRAGTISLPEFQVTVKDTLRAGHTLVASIAGGGHEQMTPRDWAKVGANVRQQYEALNRMALRIEAGGGINRGHIRLYAKAIRSTFTAFETNRQKEAGYTRATWHVTEGESCAGCIDAAGEYAIEDVPAIGSHECLYNCRCFVTFN